MEMVYIVAVKSFNTPNPYLLPLTNFFNFNFSFSILPDVISNNIPIPFFIKYFKFSFSFYIVFLYPSH